MRKTSEAIQEFYYINDLAQRNIWLNSIHPLIKLIVTISYIVTLVSFHKYDLTGTLTMITYQIIIFDFIQISFIEILKKLWPIFLLLTFVGLFNPFIDRIPMIKIGKLVVTGGMISSVTLMLKGILTTLASILLIITTGIEGVCYSLYLLHIPNVFITQILLTYRYIIVLLEEADHIFQAYTLRAPRHKGIHFKVWGSLIGQLLFRSIDRANTLFDSMLIRGYKGEFSYVYNERITLKDYLYLFAWLIVFMTLGNSWVIKSIINFLF